jgi:hypothetical protein
MRDGDPRRDNPWVLVALGVLAVVSAVFGLWCWAQILPDSVAR